MRILVINPGSTSTKTAVFDEMTPLVATTLKHNDFDQNAYKTINDQAPDRLAAVERWLSDNAIALSSFDAIAARGGLVRHVASGTYEIDDDAVADAKDAGGRQHAANLGIIMAHTLAQKAHCRAFFTDPVSTCEWPDYVHLSGFAPVPRACFFHALNHKAMAREAAKTLGHPYEELHLIVVHMGGGISVGAHKKGRVVDVFNVMDEGAFALNRSGSVPVDGLMRFIAASDRSVGDIRRTLQSQGGFVSYLGTDDFREVERRVASGDAKARLVYHAFLHQLVRDVGAMAAVLDFHVDGVVLTGGMANAKTLVTDLKARLQALAQVIILPGEREMEALAAGCRQALEKGAIRYADADKGDF